MSRFVSDKQRKFVMMRLKQTGVSQSPQIITPSGKNFKVKLKSRTVMIKANSKTLDSDGDGVKDNKDCEPFNKKKQGKLHDIAVRLLKQREQNMENKRIAELKKLEIIKEKLAAKAAVTRADLAKQQQKQAVINEINAEKQKIRELKDANKKAKQLLFRQSTIGKGFLASDRAIKATQVFFKKKSTKKALKSIGLIK